jgi:3-phenylpropionate/trans-cinnamate dioxygenase ferredoxin reductase subunit
MTAPIMIVGAGQAGAQAVQSLRQGGYAGPLTMIGAEPHLPYQRPPLSKKFLTFDTDEDRLLLRPAALYDDLNVNVMVGSTVTQIDPSHHAIRLNDGTDLTYSKLLIATGMRPRPLSIPGVQLHGVVMLRSLMDAALIRSHLKPGTRAVVIGGGYIGLEVAAVARTLGMEVIVLEAAERVLGRVVAPDVSAFFTRLHRGRGVDLRVATGVIAIEGETHVTGVKLGNGTVVPADLVLVSIGAVPETTVAEQAGLQVRDGILVDAEARTSGPDIYAAGDCARFDSALYGRSIRLESVQNAIDQAKAAAATVLGQPIAYDPVPWFWSDQYDIKLQIVGLSTGYDTIHVDGDPEKGPFSVAYLREGKLLAVDSINHPRRHMQARKMVGSDWTGWLT